jgi:hypothetical protein
LGRDELSAELIGYAFVSPTGASFADLLARLQFGLEAHEARAFRDAMESQYQFYCEGAPLTNVVQWIELRRRVGAPGVWG